MPILFINTDTLSTVLRVNTENIVKYYGTINEESKTYVIQICTNDGNAVNMKLPDAEHVSKTLKEIDTLFGATTAAEQSKSTDTNATDECKDDDDVAECK